MSPVNQDSDAALSAALGHLSNRHDQSRTACDVIDDCDAGFGGYCCVHCVDDLVRVVNGFRKLNHTDICTPYPGCVLRAMQYGAICQLRDEHFVALAEIEASEDRVDGGCCVVDEYQVISPGSEKLTDCTRRIAQSGRFAFPDTDSFR